MIRFIIKRFFTCLLTFFAILLFTFILARLLPGDPITVMYGEFQPAPEVRAALERELGLDKPVVVQFFIYMLRMLRGDWGLSVHTRVPVADLARGAFISTLVLTALSIMLATSIGLLLSCFSILYYDTSVDKVIRGVSVGTFSLPVFWWGYILILIFAVHLKWLPAGGKGSVEHLVLPSLTLAMVNLGIITRVSRASMLEALMQDHVVLAKAKGLSNGAVMVKHVVRNALVAIVTVVGLRFGVLLGGAVITETVFAYPGMGKMIVDAILSRDYPVLIGGVFVASLAVMIVNVIIDTVYAFLDPRVRVGG